MIDHISLGVSNLARSRAFYDIVLATLGQRRVMNINDDPNYAASGYGSAETEPQFWIGCGKGEVTAPVPPEGQHIAFGAADRRSVDDFYDAALAAGAKDNGRPGLRQEYHPNYYAGFVIDPDGYHLEAVCHKPA